MPRKISLRDLARCLELSPTTVSEALRGVPRVHPATRERVERAADELGYRRNSLVGAMMSELRRAKADSFRGTLAVLDLDGPGRRSEGGDRYHAEVVAGAKRRAEELGFKVDTVGAKAAGLPRARLRKVLDARGVRGVMFLPMAKPDLADVDLGGLAGLYADYMTEEPALHAICPDHYRAIFLTLKQLSNLGYRRAAFVLQDMHDVRLLYRWEAGYDAFRKHATGGASAMRCLPAYIVPYVSSKVMDEARFVAWFKKTDCDVVITHMPQIKALMEKAGARVPETHGFCCLNVINCDFASAGLDLRPELLGERGAELLIAQVLRNEGGVPSRPLTTTMPVDWVDGPTLRAQARKE